MLEKDFQGKYPEKENARYKFEAYTSIQYLSRSVDATVLMTISVEKAGHLILMKRTRSRMFRYIKNASNTALDYAEILEEDFVLAAQDLVPEVPIGSKKIPVAKRTGSRVTKTVAEVLDEGKVLFIKIHTFIEGKGVSYLFEDTTFIKHAIPLSEIPDALMAQLLEIARKGKPSE